MNPVRSARQKANLSQIELAVKANVSQATISSIEAGATTSAEVAERIAAALQISELEVLYPERYQQPAANAGHNVSSLVAP